MRRADREIKDREELRAIMEAVQVCRIGMCDEGGPYVVPMNFGLGENCLYFHCAREGRKIDILRKNGRVCFEMDILHEVRREALRCGCTASFDSIIGFGRAVILEDSGERKAALDRIMAHYGSEGPFDYAGEYFAKTAIIRIDIEEMTGKHHD